MFVASQGQRTAEVLRGFEAARACYGRAALRAPVVGLVSRDADGRVAAADEDER
jgi:hypothetical protein